MLPPLPGCNLSSTPIPCTAALMRRCSTLATRIPPKRVICKFAYWILQPKARLIKALFTSRAAHAYDRVVLEYPMAPHADDARDRLEAMNQPVPQPTQEQIATAQPSNKAERR